MIRRPPRSTLSSSSAASDVYKRQMPSLAGRAFVAAAVLTWLEALFSHLYVSEMLRCAAIFAVTVVTARLAMYSLVRTVRSRRISAHPTLILGAGRIGGQIADLLKEHSEYGLVPVGFLDGH